MLSRSSTRSRVKLHANATPKESFLARLIDPIDALSEAIYTILIALTFTLAFRVARFGGADADSQASTQQVNELLFAIVGCALAWGVIDGIMYVLMSVFDRGEKQRLLHQIQSAATEEDGVKVVAAELDHILEPITKESDRDSLYREVLDYLRDGQLRNVGFKPADFVGAFASVLIAMVAVLPSITPLVMIRDDSYMAIRVSNAVSFIVLFILGYRWGKHTGSDPWKAGLLLVTAGVIMMMIAIPLGG